LTTTPTPTHSPFRHNSAAEWLRAGHYGGASLSSKGRIGAAGRAPGRAVYIARATCDFRGMIEIVRTNDAVVISFIESLLRDAGIGFMVADQNMSVLDGSIGILPRRVLVVDEEAEQARRILTDAGISNEMRDR
jgi:hypothetical protein